MGFVLLALAQEQYWAAVSHAPVEQRTHPAWLKRNGLIAQVGALMLTLQAHGPSFGSLLWVVMMSAAAMGVAFTLAWQPCCLRPIAQLMKRTK